MSDIIEVLSITFSALLFLATIFLALVAWYQLKSLNKQSQADFILKLNRDFFYRNPKIQQIIKTIEENKSLLKGENKFDEYDIDDYLGYYELMAHFINQEIISLIL